MLAHRMLSRDGGPAAGSRRWGANVASLRAHTFRQGSLCAQPRRRAYLGLVPRQDHSGDHSPQLPITKAGNGYLRRLLIGSSHYILGPFGPDSDLRRFGQHLAERGGKNDKKRAIVAVARKLAVLLHRLWVTAEIYDPLRLPARSRPKWLASPKRLQVNRPRALQRSLSEQFAAFW